MNIPDTQAESWLIQQGKKIESELQAAKMTPEKAEKLLTEIQARYDASPLITPATHVDVGILSDILGSKELRPKDGMAQKKLVRLVKIESDAFSLQKEIGLRITAAERRTDDYRLLSVKVSNLMGLLTRLSKAIEADTALDIPKDQLWGQVDKMRQKAKQLRLYLAGEGTDGFLPIRGHVCLPVELEGGFDKILVGLRSRKYEPYRAEVDKLSGGRDAILYHLKDTRKPKRTADRGSHDQSVCSETQAKAKPEKSEPTPANGTAKLPKEPSKEARQAYFTYTSMTITQTDVAKEMSSRLGRRIEQWQVSRWVKEVRAFYSATGLPVDTPGHSRKTTPVNPSALDMGRRTDGLTAHKRRSVVED